MLNLLLTVILLTGAALGQAPAGFTKLNTSPITTTTYSDTGCPNLTSCYYVVTAVMPGGQESVGAACSSTTLCYAGNQAVAVMPSSGTHTNALAWTASIVAGATYNVYRLIPGPPSALGVTVN